MRNFDFICIGGGLGGLAGSVRAALLGMSTVVLEKTEKVGGVAAYSGGDIWAPMNPLARAEGFEDSRQAAMDYMAYVGGYGVPFSEELRETYIDTISKAVDFYMTQAGVEFHLSAGGDQFYPHAPGSVARGRSMDVTVDGADLEEWYQHLRENPYHSTMLRGWEATAQATGIGATVTEEELRVRERRKYLTRGRGLAGGFLRAALAHGVTIHRQAPVRALAYDGTRVTGVSAEIDGETVELSARRGVLIASGGYGQTSYVKDLEGLPEFGEQAPPILDGDAFRLVAATPAAVVRAGWGYVTVGYESSTDHHPGTDRPLIYPLFDTLSYPHIIAVNPEAKRFGDESVYTTLSNLIGTYDSVAKRYKNFPTYVVLDDQFRQAGYELGWRTGRSWPEEELVRADTLAGLAGKLGLDADALQATVNRFNRFCATGVDEDFHRGEVLNIQRPATERLANPSLGAIEKPPFWGCRCKIVGAGIYSHGLSIDGQARVLTMDRRPVAGLYATGNAVAYAEMPGGYQSGVANGRNFTYAYIAASDAASGA